MVQNVMETVVEITIYELTRDSEYCVCQQCTDDAKCIALNSIPPKYTSTDTGELFARAGTIMRSQTKLDINIAVINALEFVKLHPRHAPEENVFNHDSDFPFVFWKNMTNANLPYRFENHVTKPGVNPANPVNSAVNSPVTPNVPTAPPVSPYSPTSPSPTIPPAPTMPNIPNIPPVQAVPTQPNLFQAPTPPPISPLNQEPETVKIPADAMPTYDDEEKPAIRKSTIRKANPVPPPPFIMSNEE
jgi:competence protein ComFB